VEEGSGKQHAKSTVTDGSMIVNRAGEHRSKSQGCRKVVIAMTVSDNAVALTFPDDDTFPIDHLVPVDRRKIAQCVITARLNSPKRSKYWQHFANQVFANSYRRADFFTMIIRRGNPNITFP
jgi:hypothetical protein